MAPKHGLALLLEPDSKADEGDDDEADVPSDEALEAADELVRAVRARDSAGVVAAFSALMMECR